MNIIQGKSRCPLENSDFIKYIPHPMKERNDNLNFEYMKNAFYRLIPSYLA